MGGLVAMAFKRGGVIECGVGAKACAALGHNLRLLEGDPEAWAGLSEFMRLQKGRPAPYGYGLVAIDFDSRTVWGIQGYCALGKIYGGCVAEELQEIAEGSAKAWDCDGRLAIDALRRGALYRWEESAGRQAKARLALKGGIPESDAEAARALLAKCGMELGGGNAGRMPDFEVAPPGWKVVDMHGKDYARMFMEMRSAGWDLTAQDAADWAQEVKTDEFDRFAESMVSLEEKERLEKALPMGSARGKLGL